MRIAFIAGEYPPLQGGLGDFTRELARACAAAGHESHVVTRRVEGAPAGETADGVAVHRLAKHWGWGTRSQLEAFIRARGPQVLNLQYQAAAYGMHPAVNILPRALGRRLPVVVTFHDLRVPYLFPKAGPLRWQAVLAMARAARAVIVTNMEDQDTLAHSGLRNVYRVPIGSNVAPVPVGRLDCAAWRQALGAPPGDQLVGYFGFLNESKGGETLVRALAELRARGRNVSLLLIGGRTGASDPTNQAYAARLMQLAESLRVGDRIFSTGFMDDRGVSEAFAACACVALPYRDGASFRRGTLMAALAHGCAIVTTTPRVQLPELRHGDNAWLVPPDDPQALADAIGRVMAEDSLRIRLQAGSRELAGLFKWDRIAAETLRVFERLL